MVNCVLLIHYFAWTAAALTFVVGDQDVHQATCKYVPPEYRPVSSMCTICTTVVGVGSVLRTTTRVLFSLVCVFFCSLATRCSNGTSPRHPRRSTKLPSFAFFCQTVALYRSLPSHPFPPLAATLDCFQHRANRSVPSGKSNGQRLESASSGSQQQKKRRVIEDDDDDGDNDPPPSHKPRPAAAASPAGVGGGGGGGNGSLAGAKKASGMNGSSSSQSGDRQLSEKRKIMPGPPSKGVGATAGLGSTGGSSKHPAGRGNDDEDDDTPIALMMKKPKAPGAGSSGITGSKGSANNIVPNKIGSGPKNGTKSGGGSSKPAFTIPKREGLSQRASVSTGSSSNNKKKVGQSSSSHRPSDAGSSSSSSMRRDNRRYHDDDDDDFEPKPPKKKRPEDFTRDPAKLAKKRKLQEEQERRVKEEAREKKRRNTQGSSSSNSKAKAKVKAEPSGRRGAAAGQPRRPKAPAKEKAPKFKEMTRADKIEKAMKVYMWWEEPVHEPGKQWDSLEHNGAHFAPEYKPHGVKLKYDGQEVHLTTQQEEVATFYASVSAACRLAVSPSIGCILNTSERGCHRRLPSANNTLVSQREKSGGASCKAVPCQ